MSFLENLQNSDAGRKRRWLVGLSAVSMVVVIIIWLTYFDALVKPDLSAETGEEQSFSFFSTLKNGAAKFAAGIEAQLGGLTQVFKKSKNYRIVPQP